MGKYKNLVDQLRQKMKQNVISVEKVIPVKEAPKKADAVTDVKKTTATNKTKTNNNKKERKK